MTRPGPNAAAGDRLWLIAAQHASCAAQFSPIRSVRRAKLAQLRPVSFRYKSEPDATHYGLIAEEVDKVMPELVVRDEQNRPYSVQYQELIPLLLQQCKAQRELNARARKLNCPNCAARWRRDLPRSTGRQKETASNSA